LLQAVAAENNLSETGHFVPRDKPYELRWFTPRCEVKLSGARDPCFGIRCSNILDPAARRRIFGRFCQPLTATKPSGRISPGANPST
jgi:hypothetical protein